MPIVISQSGSSRRPALNIVCRESLTRLESSDLGHALKVLEQHSQSVEIDLSQVEVIDTAGLAVLVEGYVAAIARGAPFTFTGASKAVRDLIALHRLEAALPLTRVGIETQTGLAPEALDSA